MLLGHAGLRLSILIDILNRYPERHQQAMAGISMLLVSLKTDIFGMRAFVARCLPGHAFSFAAQEASFPVINLPDGPPRVFQKDLQGFSKIPMRRACINTYSAYMIHVYIYIHMLRERERERAICIQICMHIYVYV